MFYVGLGFRVYAKAMILRTAIKAFRARRPASFTHSCFVSPCSVRAFAVVRTALSTLEIRDRIRKLLESSNNSVEEWPEAAAPGDTFTCCTISSFVADLQQRAAKEKVTFPKVLPGRASLLGVVSSEPVKLGTSVISVLEDLAAEDQCVLQVDACVRLNGRQEEVDMWFPGKGAVVLIREPVCTLVSDGDQEVYPLVIVPSRAELLVLGLRTSSDSFDLKSVADQLFAKRRYVTASLYYSSVVAGAGGSASPDYVPAMTKMAEMELRMGMYQDAVSKADTALRADPFHVSSLWRKARGLHAIGDYEHEAECLKQALLKCSSDESLKQEIEAASVKCNTLLKQAKTGSYDISSFLLSGLKAEAAPECSDYVGPVEIKDGEHGRGLYVNKDVEKGELLLVSNPIAVVHACKGDVERDLRVEVVRACMGCSRTQAQLNSLVELKKLPDMGIFKPNVNMSESGIRGDWGSLRKISQVERRAGFARKIYTIDGSETKIWTGLWGLPAFINHSCLPNVTRTDMGRAMFIRAAKDLPAGTELFFLYVDAGLSWTDFDCGCKRCKLEEEHQEVLEPLSKMGESPANEIVTQVETVVQSLKEISAEDKNLIRMGFVRSYVDCDFGQFKSVEGFPSPFQLLKLLHDVAPGVEGTLTLMTKLSVKNVELENCKQTEQLLMDEIVALYGKQSAEVVESFMRKLKAEI